MARPTKFRRVEFFPENNYFVPWGKPKCEIDEINYEQDRFICPNCGSEKVMCEKKMDFCMRWCQGNSKNG